MASAAAQTPLCLAPAAPVSTLFHQIHLGRRLGLVPVGLLAAEFIEAAKHVAAKVVLSPVLRPGLNLHAPHVDFQDVVLAVLPFGDGR
jgi:hypothetical protein